MDMTLKDLPICYNLNTIHREQRKMLKTVRGKYQVVNRFTAPHNNFLYQCSKTDQAELKKHNRYLEKINSQMGSLISEIEDREVLHLNQGKKVLETVGEG